MHRLERAARHGLELVEVPVIPARIALYASSAMGIVLWLTPLPLTFKPGNSPRPKCKTPDDESGVILASRLIHNLKPLWR